MALTVLVALAIFIMLAFFRASITSWVLAMMVIVPVLAIQTSFSDDVLMVIFIALLLFIVFFGIPFMRRNVVSGAMIKIFRKVLPQISATEQEIPPAPLSVMLLYKFKSRASLIMASLNFF